MAKFRLKRRIKRKCLSNRHTVNAPTVGHVDGDVSTCAAKLANLDDNCEVPMPEPSLKGNRIIELTWRSFHLAGLHGMQEHLAQPGGVLPARNILLICCCVWCMRICTLI